MAVPAGRPGIGPPCTYSVSTEEALSSGWSGEALENLLEQPPERLPLPGVQLTEHRVLDLGERAAGPVERLAPSGRDLDHVPTPVLGVAATDRVAARLELVEEQHDHVGVEQHPFAQLLLGRPRVVAQVAEHMELLELHAQLLLEAAPVEGLGDQRHQRDEPRPLVPSSCVFLHRSPCPGMLPRILIMQTT